MKANKLNASDRDVFLAQRAALIRENDDLEQKLRTSNFDPELVNRIRYCIDKVIETGEIPEHETTLHERLALPVDSAKTVTKRQLEKTFE